MDTIEERVKRVTEGRAVVAMLNFHVFAIDLDGSMMHWKKGSGSEIMLLKFISENLSVWMR